MKKITTNTFNFLANQFHMLMIILATFFSQNAAAQDSSYADYLSTHNEKIIINGKNNFVLFDNNFYQNQVFFVSESHGYYKPHQLDAELFKQINKKN